MEKKLLQLGYRPTSTPRKADIIIVNTCGFIEKAREESLKVAKELAKKKRKGQFLLIAGCLPQLWGRKIAEEIPEADAFLGTKRWMEIGELVSRVVESPEEKPILLGDPQGPSFDSDGLSTTWGSSAYLKISEGM
jgi:2-methylthioadenine synthetase